MGTPKKSYKSTHKIEEIVYGEDRLLCICGWVGFAIDKTPSSPSYFIEFDWVDHRRNAEPINIKYEDQYKGNYPLSPRPKEKVAA